MMTLSKRMFIGALSGVFLEYFDYTLYGFSSSYIIHAFFPHEQPFVQLILAWSLFAVSFLLRPVGAILFGHFADRLGRRKILIMSILLMSVATIAIGLLPTYHYVGLAAPLGLLACRILQGLSVSTEYSGCSTYLLEFKKTRQGLISGIITSASGFGIFSASLLVLAFNSLHENIFIFANWRWPFIIAGIVVGLLGFYLRLGLTESPEFLAIQKAGKVTRFPLWQLIKKTPKTLIKTTLVSAYAGIAIILIEIYLPSYLKTRFGMQKETALQLSTYLALMEACFAITWGALSDYLGRIKTITLGGCLMIVGIFPILQLFYLPSLFFWIIAATLLAVIVAAVDGPMSAFLTNSFPTETRYTGVSVSYNFGGAIIGGLSPSLLIYLQHESISSHIFSWYLIVAACIMLIALRIKSNK